MDQRPTALINAVLAIADPGSVEPRTAADVAKAAAYLANVEPMLQIESSFCDFDGVYGL